MPAESILPQHPTAIDARAKAAVGEILPASAPVPEELPTEHTALVAHAESVRARVQALVRTEGVKVKLAISTPEAYEDTAKLFVALSAEKKAAQKLCDEDRKPHNEAYRAGLDREKQVMAGYAILDTLDSALTSYRQEETARRREAERLEQQRQQRILDDDAAQRAKDAAATAEREAQRMEAAQQPEIAQVIRSTPAPVIAETARPVVFARETPKVAGIAERGVWMNEIEEPSLVPLYFRDRIRQAINDEVAKAPTAVLDDTRMSRLTLAIATIMGDFYSLDQMKINGFIKPKKELGINLVPGLKVWFKEKTSTTGR